MFKSKGFRFFVVGFMALLMAIPLIFVSEIVNDRANYNRQTIQSLSTEWGGAQTLNGPMLQIPVTARVKVKRKKSIKDPITGIVKTTEKGEVIYEEYDVEVIQHSNPLYVLPEIFNQAISTTTEIRQRGIFNVPVYRANSEQKITYDVSDLSRHVKSNETIQWDKTSFILGVSQNKALRGAAKLSLDGVDAKLEPRNATAGLYAEIGDPRKVQQYEMTLGFLGAQHLYTTAAGRENTVSMMSDWPHPSFAGAFLPDQRDISDAGFNATWEIPHFARSVAQISRENPEKKLQQSATLGLKFYQPNDFYQKAYRAGQYGLMFIALTFLTILLLEKSDGRPVHPIQYVMIGLVQAVFVLLMVSFAEQIGFNAAYILASVATIALLTLYAFVGLKLGNSSLIVGAALAALYAVLFLILTSVDYALLAGSSLCFLAIAGTMLATRNEDWYGRIADMTPSKIKMPFQKPQQQQT
ncbi:cell envelope integrity protein CreD [Amylibacter ulvae]|uniref:Cell envelope integrity protein CreD n=1 Tax=Paramylibacter ulvae TaxID=1651968 RepID=A0ABQ3D774_9RHOB|nr:cell envelope integrity protein CreD [Amylibacter ulvae]GHA61210.1 cell envelope integrity protein CreD [Amylibacter ulvae]